jgi:hypothetical protein
MGDILNRITQNIQSNDYTHDWAEKNDTPESLDSDEKAQEKVETQSIDPFSQDGFQLRKQDGQTKGIRYGGPSSLDKNGSIYDGINLSLTNAVLDKQKENSNKLIAYVFSSAWGNQGSSNEDTDTTSTEDSTTSTAGDVYDPANSTVITKEQFKTLLSKIKNGKELQPYEDQIWESTQKWKVNPLFSIAQSAYETGWWSSDMYKASNNVGGLKVNANQFKDSGTPATGTYRTEHTEGTFSKFATPGDSFNAKLWLLRNNYIDKGKTNILEIAKKYAPNQPAKYEEMVKNLIDGLCKKIGLDPEAKTSTASTDNSVVPITDGSVTSKIKWTPGQELGTPVKDFKQMNAKAYGVPAGKAGQKWMKGDGKAGIHLEMESAIKACNAAMGKEAGFSPMTYTGFRSNAQQAAAVARHARGDGAHAAPVGNSAHECGYGIDQEQAGKKRAWWHKNAMRFGLAVLGELGHTEDWHFQIHPDLAYILTQRWIARGKKW